MGELCGKEEALTTLGQDLGIDLSRLKNCIPVPVTFNSFSALAPEERAKPYIISALTHRMLYRFLPPSLLRRG
jgi:hypothetical protein